MLVKNPPAMWETWVQSLGCEDPLEKRKATHSSVLAWRIPWGHEESETTERVSNYGGGSEDNSNLQKVPCRHYDIQCSCQPCSRPPSTPHLRLLGTHREVWISLLWGHCSFLLGPGTHKVLFAPFQSLFPQSCVSDGSSMVGLMVTSSKRAYAIPKSAAPRAFAPAAVHC